MWDQYFMRCINAPGAADRRDRFAALAQAHGLPVEIVEGADARRLEQETLRTRYDAAERARRGRPPITRGEQACLESHARALAAFLDGDRPYAVIFEDNVAFDAELLRFLKAVPLERLEFDVIRLEQRKRSRWNLPVWRGAGFALVFSPHIGAGVCGMLYSRRGAEKLLRSVETYHQGYDNGIGYFWRAGLRAMTVLPPIAWRAPVASTVDRVDGEFSESRNTPAPMKRTLSQRIAFLQDHLERQICKYLYSAFYTIEAKLRS